ncbi:MAG: hypothetical protein ACPGJV_01165 [Bacteriovoracaceae bacterium]
MEQENEIQAALRAEARKDRLLGQIYFVVFVILILGGVITKRVFGHPEFMMAWHIPGAVFLVLSGMKISKSKVAYYQRESKIMNKY